MTEWWQSIRALTATATAYYTDWEHRTEAIELRRYIEPIRQSASPQYDREGTRERFDSLESTLGTDPVLETLSGADIRTPTLGAEIDAALILGAVLTDLEAQTPKPPYDEVTDPLSTAVTTLEDGETAAEPLEAAATRLRELIKVVVTAEETIRRVQNVEFGYPEDDADDARDRIIDAVSDGDLKRTTRLHRAVVNRQWTQSWVETFGPHEFEQLVADLYRAKGYSARVQEKGADGGVDIVVERDGIRKLVQVKHHSEAISAPEFDKYVSLLQYYDTDEVVLVTSSSFTGPALDRWRQVADRVQPIDGNELCRLLATTNIVPPLDGE